MALRSTSSSLTNSSAHDHPWPERSRLLNSPGSVPPTARICFALLPLLGIQSPPDSSAVRFCFPSVPGLFSHLNLCSDTEVPCLVFDGVPSPSLTSVDFPSLNSYSSPPLHASGFEVQRKSSSVPTSLSIKGELHGHTIMHGFSQLASWGESLDAVLRSRKFFTARNEDQNRNFTLHWSEKMAFPWEGKRSVGGKLFCSIGLSGTDVRGVEKMSISQVQASLTIENHNVQGSSFDIQSFSAGEACERLTEQDTGSEKKVLQTSEGNMTFQTGKHLLAGAASAIVSRTFVAPLERLKLEYMIRGAQGSLLQIIPAIIASEGVTGFWRGNVVNLLRTAPFKSINFYCYDMYRKKLLEITAREEITNSERLVAGAAAGISATVLCIPMDTIRTRILAPGGEALGGIIGCFQHMLQTEGFFSLYKGLLPAVISMAPSGAVFYGVYDILKSSYLQSPEGKKDLRRRIERERVRRKSEGKVQGDLKKEATNLGQLELGAMRTLLYGAVAGICAETATYPFEVVRRQLQMQDAATKMGALATCCALVENGGIGALYAGLLPSALQVLPSAALSYFVYESLKIALNVP